MTLGILILIFSFIAMIGSLITIITFSAYLCSKKRKATLEKLEQSRLEAIAKIEKEIEKNERVLNNDTSSTVEIIKANSNVEHLKKELEILTAKK